MQNAGRGGWQGNRPPQGRVLPVQPPSRVEARVAEPEPAVAETDEELGIGQPDEHDALAEAAKTQDALLQNPDIARLIDAAVERRMAMLAEVPQASNGTAAIVAGIEKLVTMHAQQQPGYSKPLAADEVARRDAGFADMIALIDRYRSEGLKPKYKLVGEPFFKEMLFPEGSVIAMFDPPNEFMMPMDEPSRQVHAAMMRWIGGPQKSIAERVEEAERERRNNGVYDPSPFRPAPGADQMTVDIVEPPEETRQFDPRRPPQTAYDAAQQGIIHQV